MLVMLYYTLANLDTRTTATEVPNDIPTVQHKPLTCQQLAEHGKYFCTHPAHQQCAIAGKLLYSHETYTGPPDEFSRDSEREINSS